MYNTAPHLDFVRLSPIIHLLLYPTVYDNEESGTTDPSRILWSLTDIRASVVSIDDHPDAAAVREGITTKMEEPLRIIEMLQMEVCVPLPDLSRSLRCTGLF